MANVRIVSATTRGIGGWSKQDRFLANSRRLLGFAEECLAAGDTAQALEHAYQAALRAAGARSAGSVKVAKRKRLPSSAWERLKLVDADGVKQAEQFSAYSVMRSRVGSGIAPAPKPEIVEGFMREVQQFLAFAEVEAGGSSHAA